MIEITYYYSACVGIRTPDVSILCDPWFSEGIYDGAWYQLPRLDDPLETLGAYDAIYVSHIHPDHYDPEFLRIYLDRHPQTELWIADFEENFLERKMRSEGFAPEVLSRRAFRDTEIALVTNAMAAYPVDSAMLVKHQGHAVANFNDNPYDPKQLTEAHAFLAGSTLKVALLPWVARDVAVEAEDARSSGISLFDDVGFAALCGMAADLCLDFVPLRQFIWEEPR